MVTRSKASGQISELRQKRRCNTISKSAVVSSASKLSQLGESHQGKKAKKNLRVPSCLLNNYRQSHLEQSASLQPPTSVREVCSSVTLLILNGKFITKRSTSWNRVHQIGFNASICKSLSSHHSFIPLNVANSHDAGAKPHLYAVFWLNQYNAAAGHIKKNTACS